MTSPRGSYQVLARRYRPQTFAEVCGQETIVTTLKNALRSGRLAYAYLFAGTRGTGKTTLARLLAKALNCAHPQEDGEPCNHCQSCREIIQGSSLDVLEIDGASNRGIDDIRQMTETVGYAPAHGKFKIYIIDEVHMLTKEAFNALLKTLEEPPAHVKFFFATTEPHKVLPTILSRCQRFDLRRISSTAMFSKLSSIVQEQGYSIEDEALRIVVHAAEGSLRDAESLLDQLLCSSDGHISVEIAHTIFGITPRAQYFQLNEAILHKNVSFAVDAVSTLSQSGKDLGHFLEGLLEHFRILLLTQWQRPLPAMPSEDEKMYRQHASQFSEAQCMNLLESTANFWQQMGKTPFKRIFLEMFLLQVIRSSHLPSYAELVKRLVDLEDSIDGNTLSIEKSMAEDKHLTPPLELVTAEIPDISPSVPEMPMEKVETTPESSVHPSRYETLMRFAAVELEGSLTKI